MAEREGSIFRSSPLLLCEIETNPACPRDRDQGSEVPDSESGGKRLSIRPAFQYSRTVMTGMPFTARVARIRALTPDVREITLDLLDPPELTFVSGQSICVQIPGQSVSQPSVRFYSLASPSGRATSVSLLVRTQDRGAGSSYIARWKEGDEIVGHGPVGRLRLLPHGSRDLLLVATGTGIAPFRSLLLSIGEAPLERSVTLLWGLRSEENLYYHDELQSLSERQPRFSYRITLSSPSREWTGATGRVTTHVGAFAQDRNLAVYVCGHPQMVAEVHRVFRAHGHRHVYSEGRLGEL